MTRIAHLFDYNQGTETSGPGSAPTPPDLVNNLDGGVDMVDATCSFDGCEKPAEIAGRDVCRKHYMRLWRSGSLTPLPPRPRRSAFDRVLARLDRSDPEGCWLIPGADPTVHAPIAWMEGDQRFSDRTYRVVYAGLVGPIPEGQVLHHHCLTPGCCNPRHLQPVTPLEHQAIHVGLGLAGPCPRCGATEWVLLKRGSRRCRQCHRAGERRRKERIADEAERMTTRPEPDGGNR